MRADSPPTHRLPSSIVDWVALNESASSWEGSLSSKAWRLLELYLIRFDNPSFKYSLVVLEHSLAINERAVVPKWLVDGFQANDERLLIATMLKFDRLEDAFDYSRAAIAVRPLLS